MKEKNTNLGIGLSPELNYTIKRLIKGIGSDNQLAKKNFYFTLQ